MSRPAASSIRVLLVDDHAIVREGLRMLLGGTPDLTVVGEASNGGDALAAAARASPDVVLLDLDLGGQDGLPLVSELQRASSAKTLILTGARERERHEAALLAGAHGVVVKDRPADLLLKAIRRVHAGELWFDRALLEAVVHRAVRREEPQADPEATKIAKLTEREREIVTLIGEGLRNEEIGRRLFISEKTVRNHLSTIFEKVGVNDRLELVVYAFNNGLARMRR